MLSYHSSLRKTIRWYKKIGLHIVELLLVNSFYLYERYSRQPRTNTQTLCKFRETVVRHLVGELKPLKGAPVRANFHYLTIIPPTAMKTKPSRECKHCSRKNCNKRKESRYICALCPEQPALCVEPCFRLWHKLRVETDNMSSDEEEDTFASDSDDMASDSVGDESDA